MNNVQGFRHNRIGSMALPTKKNGRTAASASPNTLAPPATRKERTIPYKDLRDLYYFKRDGRVFLKIGNSHAIDQRTGKDAIFSITSKVVPLWQAAADLVF